MFTKYLSLFILALVALTTGAEASVVGGKPFSQVIHVAYGPTSTQSARNSGLDYSSPKGFYDGDLLSIPKNVVITNIYVVVDTTVSGITAFNLGDDDAASGFVASSSPTFTADNLYFWSVDYKGSYLKGGPTLTSAEMGKYYSATGKELKLDVTGTAAAGKIRIFVHGYATGLAQ